MRTMERNTNDCFLALGVMFGHVDFVLRMFYVDNYRFGVWFSIRDWEMFVVFVLLVDLTESTG